MSETKLDIEVCRSTAPNVAVRATDFSGTEAPVMEGHFATFNEWYEIKSIWEGHFMERIAPGAFKRTFNAAKSAKDPHRISVILEHGFDPSVGDKPLGVPSTLTEDDEGPKYEVPLFDTSYNRDLLPALSGEAYGSSFRFRVLKESFIQPEAAGHSGETDLPERTIKEVRVMEFGPTIFPANPSATAGLRSLTDEYYEKLRTRNPEQFDRALRSAAESRGLSDSDLLERFTQEEHEELNNNNNTSSEEKEEVKSEDNNDSQTEHLTDPSTPEEETLSDSDTSETREESTRDDSDTENNPSNSDNKKRSVNKHMDTDQMTVSQRQERVKEIDARLLEIDSEFNGAALDDETRTEWEGLFEERADHETAIADAEARRERLESIAAGEDENFEGKSRSTERARPVGKKRVNVANRKVSDIYDMAEYRRSANSLDELASMYKEGALRALDEAIVPTDEPEKAKERAQAMLEIVDDEEATVARRMLVTGSPVYQRAFGKAVSRLGTGGLSADEQRALALGTGADGGFAVPFQLDPTIILTSDGQINPLRNGMARIEQITGKEWQGVTSAGVTVTRAAEAAESTDDAPTLAQPTVRTERVQGFIPFSMEAELTWNRLRAEMLMLLADAKEAEEADSFINGDGTSNKPFGLLSEGSGTGNANVTRVDTASVTTFAVEDVYSVKNAVPPRFRARAQFLAETAIYDEVRQFDSAGGSSLWVQLQADIPARLIGYQARETSEMDSSVANGNDIMVFGDFQQFLIVDRVGMNVELVPHLLGSNQRPTGERGLFAIWHNNCKVLVPGAFRVLNVASS